MDKPEPLWRPIGEEEEDVQAASSEDIKPSVSKPSQGDANPPSPRTLDAIQAAMKDSSDDEKVDQDRKDGSVSPRTLLAIQQALTEEEDGASSSTTKLQGSVHHPVVISSSEEETQASPKEKRDFKSNVTARSLRNKDSLFDSSSEDELERIGQRNKALQNTALQQNSKTEMQLGEERVRRTEKQEEPEDGELAHKPQPTLSDRSTSAISLTPPPRGKPVGTETDVHPELLEQRRDKLPEVLKETKENNVKSESREGSESEGTVISLRSNCFEYLGN